MLEILKQIYTLLLDNTEVTDLIGDKAFPNVVPDKDSSGENIDYPLLVLSRVSIEPTYSKSCSIDSCIVSVTAYSRSYNEAVELAVIVRDTLEGFKGEVAGLYISDINLLSADEGFADISYYQRLSFQIK